MKRIFQFSFLMLIAIMAMTSCKEDNDISVTGLNLVNTEDLVVIAIGNTYEMKVSVEPSGATEKGVIWTSSNSGVASVLGGVITANLPGFAEIVATTVDGAKSAAIEVIVTNPPVGIVFESDLKIAVGERTFPKYGFMPPSATDKSVKWSSSNENVATVDASTGEITGVTFGTTTITAVLLSNNNVTGNCKVEVSAIFVTGVTLTPKTLNLEVGETSTISYATIPSNAENQSVTWSTSDAGIATVDQLTGLITGITEGQAAITVTTLDGGFTDDCLVTVSAAVGVSKFVRVNAAPADNNWSGTYLIVNDADSRAWDGELTITSTPTLDALNNWVAVTIVEGVIESNTLSGATFTIVDAATLDPAATGWAIKSASGIYIGSQLTSGNGSIGYFGDVFLKENHMNTISLATVGGIDNSAVIQGMGTNVIRYNTTGRFTYFPGTQQPVALYKLQ